MTLTYECTVGPRDTVATIYWQEYIHASGETRAEVEADAQAQCARMHGHNLQAVGVHNTREDWEAMFGPTDLPDTAFRPRPILPWYRRLLQAVTR